MGKDVAAHPQATTHHYIMKLTSITPKFPLVAIHAQAVATVFLIGMAVRHSSLIVTHSKASAMLYGVCSDVGQQFKVIKSVISLVVVDVMNYSTLRNRTISLLPNMTVLKHSAAVEKRKAYITNFHQATVATFSRWFTFSKGVIA